MAKAILEFEMPESCYECKLTAWNTFGDCMMCSPLKTKCPEKGKRSDCPLKLVEGKEVGCEYCNTEPVSIYRKDWTIFEKGEDKGVDINYCPMCGRRLEVEP